MKSGVFPDFFMLTLVGFASLIKFLYNKITKG